MSNLATTEAGMRSASADTWLRALQLTASISRNPSRTLPIIIQEIAERLNDAPALLSDGECLSYSGLAARQNQYARWALEQGIEQGDIVGLLMPNCPEYLAAWLGISSIGGVTALFNTNLSGASLSHCIRAVSPNHIVVKGRLAGTLSASLQELSTTPIVWSLGGDHEAFRSLEPELERQERGALNGHECRPVTIRDRALCIYTSGTTGLPKAANVSHARILQWSYWFAGMLGLDSTDRIYNCLPMCHSIGGVLAPGAALVSGGSVVVRDKFSATEFWNDIIRWKCTAFQYIGELCRYLLHATSSADAVGHQLRIACGNGMSADIWDEFKSRFGIPKVLEFYASTEGGVSLFNIEEKRGAIGRVPPYLRHRLSPELIKVDTNSGNPVRDNLGLCVQCHSNEVGEAIGRAVDDASAIGTRFEGYTDEKASETKLLRNVFKPGDLWIRTGDLMRKDEKGFYYFVDRLGDSFRWKGENVASLEVSQAICGYPGVKHANVYGVRVPSADGRAGMAAVVAAYDLEIGSLRAYLRSRLPRYARPLFIRLRDEMDANGTFKYTKNTLAQQGYDPGVVTDPIYFDHPEKDGFVRLDQALYERIQHGEIRL